MTESRSAVYVSTPLTTGRRAAEWRLLNGTDIGLESDEFSGDPCSDANRKDAARYVATLRTSERRVVFDPAAFEDLPGWDKLTTATFGARGDFALRRGGNPSRRVAVQQRLRLRVSRCYKRRDPDARRAGCRGQGRLRASTDSRRGRKGRVHGNLFWLSSGVWLRHWKQGQATIWRGMSQPASHGHFKDEILARLGEKANVAQFVSFGPLTGMPIRHSSHAGFIGKWTYLLGGDRPLVATLGRRPMITSVASIRSSRSRVTLSTA